MILRHVLTCNEVIMKSKYNELYGNNTTAGRKATAMNRQQIPDKLCYTCDMLEFQNVQNHYDAGGVAKWPPRPRPLWKPLGFPRSTPGTKPRPPRGANPPRRGPPLGSKPLPRKGGPPRPRAGGAIGPFGGEAALPCPLLADPFSLIVGADLLAGTPPRTTPPGPPRPRFGLVMI